MLGGRLKTSPSRAWAGLLVLLAFAPLAACPRSVAAESSLNWAGYVQAPASGRIVEVSGKFVVPEIRSPLPPGFASTWVGIGGFHTSDLIQAGAAEDTVESPSTGPHYSAWFELLPAASTPLTGCHRRPACPVRPGDRMRVQIRQVGTNRWSIAVVDAHRWTWNKTVRYASSGSSAEWIAEASSLTEVPTLYGDIGLTRFDHGRFTVSGHGKQPIAAPGDETTVIGVDGLAAEATPSGLDPGGDGFNVCAYTTTCPAPKS